MSGIDEGIVDKAAQIADLQRKYWNRKRGNV